MSASLVGSEMCIRDREAVLRERAAWACRDRGLLGLGLGPPAKLSALGAVSYTHLTLPTICSV
eukprot:131865-Alexandrium_andersonii.AAC.1